MYAAYAARIRLLVAAQGPSGLSSTVLPDRLINVVCGYPFNRPSLARGVRRRALQARWTTAAARRPMRSGARPGVGDQVAVAHRVVGGGELEHAVEDEPAAARAAAVEVEHELVEVAGQVRRVDRALVGAQQPPLGQRGDLVHAGEQLRGIRPGRARERCVDVEVAGRRPVSPRVGNGLCCWVMRRRSGRCRCESTR
jgi:hypothetical protein